MGFYALYCLVHMYKGWCNNNGQGYSNALVEGECITNGDHYCLIWSKHFSADHMTSSQSDSRSSLKSVTQLHDTALLTCMAFEWFVAIVSDASKHLMCVPEKTKMATVWGFCSWWLDWRIGDQWCTNDVPSTTKLLEMPVDDFADCGSLYLRYAELKGTRQGIQAMHIWCALASTREITYISLVCAHILSARQKAFL